MGDNSMQLWSALVQTAGSTKQLLIDLDVRMAVDENQPGWDARARSLVINQYGSLDAATKELMR